MDKTRPIPLPGIALLIALLATAAFAQPATVEDSADTIDIYNDWIQVSFTKVQDFVAPGSIVGAWDRRVDTQLTENFVNARWLDLFGDVVHGNGSIGTAVPDTLTVVNTGANWFILRTPRFVDEETGQAVPLGMKITVRLVRNRVYVSYEFVAQAKITLASPLTTASFIRSVDMDSVEAFNWTRKNHRNPFVKLSGDRELTFDPIIQPANQVRFSGDLGAVDFHSPDTAMDHVAISNTTSGWILFNPLTPMGESCCSDQIYHEIPAGTRINKTIAILVNNDQNAGLFELTGLPSATFPAIPNGNTNVMVNMVDDLPTLTQRDGQFYNVYDEDSPTGANIDQFYQFLEQFTDVNLDLNLVFDSMLNISQSTADNRTDSNNTDFIIDVGASFDQVWNFHNALKNIARAAGQAYHDWLANLQNDTLGINGRIGLVNRSYQLVRLDDVTLSEFENDPAGRLEDITEAHVRNVLSALAEDAATIGLSVPRVFIAPRLCFDKALLEPLVEFGTEAAVFCIRRQLPHSVYTPDGPLQALYYNWFPTMNTSRFQALNLMRRGWPVIGLGEYFNGTENRFNKLSGIFTRAAQVFPNTSFMLAEDYAEFVRERDSIVFINEVFDTSNGELLVRFKGSSNGSLSVAVKIDPRTRTIAGITLDGLELNSYRVHNGMLYISLPELEGGLHRLVVDLF